MLLKSFLRFFGPALFADPRSPWLFSFRQPSQGQIHQLNQTGINFHYLMETSQHRTRIACHAVAEKLPSPVVSIMRNIGDWLITFTNCYRQKNLLMRIVWEFPTDSIIDAALPEAAL